jgi:hypothetical protein
MRKNENHPSNIQYSGVCSPFEEGELNRIKLYNKDRFQKNLDA